MMASILEWMKAARFSHSIPAGACLEVGSLNINGSPRVVFPDADSYWGIDLLDGPGVDQVGDAELLLGNHYRESFNTVICCECLEHVARPWILVDQMKSLLKLGGFLWISTPTYGFPLHRFPLDCYRFGEDAYREWLFQDMILYGLQTVCDELGQPAIVAVGQKCRVPEAGKAVHQTNGFAGRND